MTRPNAAETRPETGAGYPALQQVSWWATHQFIEALLAQVNTSLPQAGTPAWRALDDADPRKLLALAAAGEHHVLRIEAGQDAICQAGEDIWTGGIATTVRRLREIDTYRRTA